VDALFSPAHRETTCQAWTAVDHRYSGVRSTSRFRVRVPSDLLPSIRPETWWFHRFGGTAAVGLTRLSPCNRSLADRSHI